MFNYNFIPKVEAFIKYNTKIIKFEDLHLNSKNLLLELSSYLNITYSETLLESTIAGELWWGTNPLSKPVQGLNPNFLNSNLNDDFDKQSKALCSFIFNDLESKYNYNKIYLEDIENSNINLLIKYEFESLIFLIFREFLLIDQLKIYLKYFNNPYIKNNLFFSEKYPIIRKKALSYFNSISDPDINEIIDINGIQIFIKNVFRKNFVYPNNGYFIFFSYWDKGYLPIKIVYLLNSLTDQIWVPNKFIKNLYIESGIIEEKIFIIPYGVDKKSITSIYDFYPESKVKKFNLNLKDNLFIFLFIGELNLNSGIDIIIKAYNDLFSNNEKSCLLILDTSKYYKLSSSHIKRNNSDDSLSLDNLIRNTNDSYIINEISNNTIFLDTNIFGYDLNSLYEKVDCAIYPFRYDPLCLRIPEIMINQVPVIITNNGVVNEFCNTENSYLLRNELIDLESDTIDEVKLAGNRFEFLPDIEHLKFLMKYAYDNPEETKTKGKNAKKYVEENFSWDKTFKLVYENIESLKGKPIFRHDFLSKKEKLDSQIDTHIKNKDYESAELILLNLIVYDISYIYKLSDVLIKQDKYEEALDYLTQILDYEGLSYSLCIMIANCLEKTGDIETSIEYYNKSKDLIP